MCKLKHCLMCSFGLFCISLVGWIETLGELSQIVRAQILVCDNGEVLEYLIQGNQHGYCAVHTPQCRMPYAVFETIHVNGEVLEYLIQGNQHGYCSVHTPQCRTYGTMPYAV